MEIKECSRCGHEKSWNGSDISCPFQNSDIFGENWNCGIIGLFQSFLYDKVWYNESLPDGMQYQHVEDQSYVTIKVSDVDELHNWDEDSEQWFLSLWITWYKRRGAIDNMLLLPEKGEPVHPTFDQLKAIAQYYNLPKYTKHT